MFFLYKEGASDVEVRGLIYDWLDTFSQSLWERWIREDEEFSITVKKGKEFSNIWWEKAGRKNLDSVTFSYTGWYMNMKNRFNWADRQETNNVTTNNINVLNVDPLED